MNQIRCVEDAIDALVMETFGESSSRRARQFKEALQCLALLAKTEESLMVQQNFRMLSLLPEDCLRH